MHSIFDYAYISPSIFDEWKKFSWMNACMHDYAKEQRIHGGVKSTMLEFKG